MISAALSSTITLRGADRTRTGDPIHSGCTRTISLAKLLSLPVQEKRTRTYIYFVREEDGPIKIGHTGNPRMRLNAMQVGNPRPLYMLSYVDAPKEIERRLHDFFLPFRITGEWYEPTDVIFDAIEMCEEKFGEAHRHECEQCARQRRFALAGRELPEQYNQPHTCGIWARSEDMSAREASH